jgi:cytochrome c oxidase assembly protein Cox11
MTEGFKSGDRKTMIRRYLNQVDADILNLAVFGITPLNGGASFHKRTAERICETSP